MVIDLSGENVTITKNVNGIHFSEPTYTQSRFTFYPSTFDGYSYAN